MKTLPLPPILSLGDAIRPATYRLLAVHRRSRVYATPSRRRLLFAVAPSIGPGPLNLVLSDPHVLPGVITLRPLPPAPVYRSLAPAPLPRPLRDALSALLRTHFPRLAPPDSLVTLAFPDPARTANPLSNAFLSLAADTRVHAPMLALLSSPSPDTLLPVLRFGHTSGADLLCALALLL